MGDRKYRQSGYQDDDRAEPRKQQPTGPRETREGPRGRGLGAPTAAVFRCARCGAKGSFPDGVPLDATCASCNSDLHTCTHCRHFDAAAPYECRQPVAQGVQRKASRNTCELFEPKTAIESEGSSARSTDARSAFDALFKF